MVGRADKYQRTIAGNFDIMVGGNSKDAELQVKTLTLQ